MIDFKTTFSGILTLYQPMVNSCFPNNCTIFLTLTSTCVPLGIALIKLALAYSLRLIFDIPFLFIFLTFTIRTGSGRTLILIFLKYLSKCGSQALKEEAAQATTRRADAKMITKDLILWLDLKIMNTEAGLIVLFYVNFMVTDETKWRSHSSCVQRGKRDLRKPARWSCSCLS